MGCGWWNRWYHKRLRHLDAMILLPTFQLKALETIDLDLPQPEFYQQLHEKVDAMFELHKSLPGQDHWRCECSQQ